MTQKINLPPVPDLPSYPAEVFDREINVVSETMVEQLMRDYATAAIEAYRQARGESVKMPSDEDIRAMWNESCASDFGNLTSDLVRHFARALLSKYVPRPNKSSLL